MKKYRICKDVVWRSYFLESPVEKVEKSHQPTICVDVDGTLASYKGWQGPEHFGEPIYETIAVVQRLKEEGWKVIIFTSRQDTPHLRNWLDENKIPFDEINKNSDNPDDTSVKPVASVYLDDRAVSIGGQSADKLYKQIIEKHKYVQSEEKEGEVKKKSPTTTVDVYHIHRPHGVKNQEKLDDLVAKMKKSGWVERPVLVEKDDINPEFYWAITGSHRISAARVAGIKEIPVYIIDTEKFARAGFERDNGPKGRRGYMNKFKTDIYKLDALMKIDDLIAVDLMQYECNKNAREAAIEKHKER